MVKFQNQVPGSKNQLLPQTLKNPLRKKNLNIISFFMVVYNLPVIKPEQYRNAIKQKLI